MRNCIMVKIGGSKKRKLSPKSVKFAEIGGQFISFSFWNWEYSISIIGLGEWTSLVTLTVG